MRHNPCGTITSIHCLVYGCNCVLCPKCNRRSSEYPDEFEATTADEELRAQTRVSDKPYGIGPKEGE